MRKGDTLYGIALDHGLDYRELASWNEIADPNLIRVDQKLRLHAPPGWQPPPEPATAPAIVSQPLPPAPEIEAKPLAPLVVKTGPKAVKLAYSEAALAQLRGDASKPLPACTGDPGPAGREDCGSRRQAGARRAGQAADCSATSRGCGQQARACSGRARAPMPAGSGRPTARSCMASTKGSNPKGVAIGGETGQPIFASAAGKVVYSGSGLRGYGKLIIIKHSDTYLSVYAHNKTLLVKEGERVVRGQKIAEMGDSDSQRVSLHFEIRRLGKPVDPLQYLPEGGAS